MNFADIINVEDIRRKIKVLSKMYDELYSYFQTKSAVKFPNEWLCEKTGLT